MIFRIESTVQTDYTSLLNQIDMFIPEEIDQQNQISQKLIKINEVLFMYFYQLNSQEISGNQKNQSKSEGAVPQFFAVYKPTPKDPNSLQNVELCDFQNNSGDFLFSQFAQKNNVILFSLPKNEDPVIIQQSQQLRNTYDYTGYPICAVSKNKLILFAYFLKKDSSILKKQLSSPKIICNKKCNTCSKSKDLCDTCTSDKFRLNNPPQCDCKPGFYEDKEGLCKQCNNKVCSTCKNGPEDCILKCPNKCRFCDVEGKCLSCGDGQYLSQGLCEPCPKKCSNCILKNSEIQCIKCKKGIGRSETLESNCGCLPGFYENGDKQNCRVCNVQNCLQCDQQGLCIKCKEKTQLLPDCLSVEKGYVMVKGNNSEISIQQCEMRCETCKYRTNHCTSCKPGANRSLQPPCECVRGFHDNEGQFLHCEKCHYSCKTCLNKDECLQCNQDKLREKNSFTGKCECKLGYKENLQTFMCQKCFSYQGKCFLSCPQNTVPDKKEYICSPKKRQFLSSQTLIWILSISIIVIISITFYCIAQYLKSLDKKRVLELEKQQTLRASKSSKHKQN